MTRQLKRLNKGILTFISFIIVSAIVGVVRLGYFLGSKTNGEVSKDSSSEALNSNLFIPSAMADIPTGSTTSSTTTGDAADSATDCSCCTTGTTGGITTSAVDTNDTDVGGNEGSSEGSGCGGGY